MPSLTDLFNPTFLIFLGILMLVAALIVVYFESRMREQNHKIASMLSLVSSLAEELNGVKFGLNHLSMRGGSIPPAFVPQNHLAQNLNNSLIAVSDDDESGSDDDDEEEESISDEESVSDEEDIDLGSDEEEESISNEEFNNGTDLKVFKLNISSHDNDNFETEDIDNFETEELNDDQSLSGNSSITSVNKTSELIVSEFINETHNNETHNNNNENNNNEENVISQTEFKTININLEEHIDTLDYKKLQLAKLRSIVTEKGLSTDSNKLKKNELLKLLGAE